MFYLFFDMTSHFFWWHILSNCYHILSLEFLFLYLRDFCLFKNWKHPEEEEPKKIEEQQKLSWNRVLHVSHLKWRYVSSIAKGKAKKKRSSWLFTLHVGWEARWYVECLSNVVGNVFFATTCCRLYACVCMCVSGPRIHAITYHMKKQKRKTFFQFLRRHGSQPASQLVVLNKMARRWAGLLPCRHLSFFCCLSHYSNICLFLRLILSFSLYNSTHTHVHTSNDCQSVRQTSKENFLRVWVRQQKKC